MPNAPLDDSMLHVASVTFKDAVEKLSAGKIQAKVFPRPSSGRRRNGEPHMTGAQDVFSTSLTSSAIIPAPRML